MFNNLNVDGVFTGHVGALTHNNKIANLPEFAGSSTDEMAFDDLVTLPSLINPAIPWSTSAIPGDSLTVIPLAPSFLSSSNLFRTLSGTQGTLYRGPVVMHLARSFKMYRGGFRITLKFVKTEFHSGRISIAFAPSVDGTAGAADLSNITYLHRDILDVRGLVEYSFDVDFVSPLPYLPVDQAFGHIYINVVNELTCPATVATTINVIAEMAALPGFELAIPASTTLINADDSTAFASVVYAQGRGNGFSVPLELLSSVESSSAGFRFESTVTPIEDASIVDRGLKKGSPLGELSQNNSNLAAAQMCIGEKIMSVRQLVKRPNISALINTDYTNNSSVANGYYVDSYIPDLGWASPAQYNYQTCLDYFSGWYAFRRGSTNYRLAPVVGQLDAINYQVIPRSDTTSGLAFSPFPVLTNLAQSSTNANGLYSYEKIPLTGSLDINVPYYNNLPYVPVRPYAFVSPENYSRLAFGVIGAGSYFGTTTSTTYVYPRISFYKSAGDDFSLGFFTSTGYTLEQAGPADLNTLTRNYVEYQGGAYSIDAADVLNVNIAEVAGTTATNPLEVTTISGSTVAVTAENALPINIQQVNTANISGYNVPIDVKYVAGYDVNTQGAPAGTLPVGIQSMKSVTTSTWEQLDNSNGPVHVTVDSASTTVPVNVNAINGNALTSVGTEAFLPVGQYAIRDATATTNIWHNFSNTSYPVNVNLQTAAAQDGSKLQMAYKAADLDNHVKPTAVFAVGVAGTTTVLGDLAYGTNFITTNSNDLGSSNYNVELNVNT